MITILNFGLYPKGNVPHSIRLVSTYLNHSSIVKSIDKEDSRNLGLVYFVNGVLYSHNSNSKVDMSLFSLVESKEDFFKYPFGKESFKKILIGLNKVMIHYRGLYLKVLEKER